MGIIIQGVDGFRKSEVRKLQVSLADDGTRDSISYTEKGKRLGVSANPEILLVTDGRDNGVTPRRYEIPTEEYFEERPGETWRRPVNPGIGDADWREEWVADLIADLDGIPIAFNSEELGP